MIRILIGRSEKDLGDIVQCFAEENYGEGKTLKQWMDNALKGSFRRSLLEIAGAIEHDDNAYNDYSDFASYTDSEAADGYEHSLYLPRKVTLDNAKTAPAPSSPTQSETKNYAMIVSSPEEVDEEIQRQHGGGVVEPAVEDVYDPYDIDEGEFGVFIVEKVNDKTAQRLMQHLKSGNDKRNDDGDEYEDDVIKSHQCIHVMLFACVLYLKYVEKTENKPEIQIDKKKLKKALMPSYNWMMENKLKDDMTIPKSNYKILGEWLQEFRKLKESNQ